MKLYGLIGQSLAHSLSPQIFSEIFRKENQTDVEYRLFPMKDLSQLWKLLQENPELCGFNVTIPFKQLIVPYLDETDKISAETGVVNTVKVIRSHHNISLSGYNTDVIGFEKTLTGYVKVQNVKALVLGSGGVSKSVEYVLKKLNISYLTVSRKASPYTITYEQLNEEIIRSHQLIINCTPLGMFPYQHTYPKIPYNFLDSGHYLYDMVYNPAETVFLKKGLEKGSFVKNGIEMLHIQAKEAWKIWSAR